MTAKSKLIIPDANVIIRLHELHKWQVLVNNYDVMISETVVEECEFYNDPITKKKIIIDLKNSTEIGIFAFEASKLSEIDSILRKKGRSIDDGEKESIAAVYNKIYPDAILCLAERAAIISAVLLGLKDNMVSPETAFSNIGQTLKIGCEYSESSFRSVLKEASIIFIQDSNA